MFTAHWEEVDLGAKMDFCCLLAISLAHHPFYAAISLGIHSEYWAGEPIMYLIKLI